MYQYEKKTLNEGQAYKYILYRQDEQLTYSNFITFLQQDEQFRLFFIKVLSNIPFHAYQWQTPPVSTSTADQLFEFVINKNPGIDLPPDPGPFRQYFHNANNDIAIFNNLGNDARLIAPAPVDSDLNYSHIGIFTEMAPREQQQALWQKVGQVTEQMISDHPLWLNTAGGGVAWLHLRLDSRPKYYRHQPYM